MQTFLPYPNIERSLKALDNKRLGKQRVETLQIINTILGRPKLDGTPYKGWLNHPCSIMWRKHVPLLKIYLNACIDEWVRRGFKNTMNKEIVEENVIYPEWWGNQKFHDSHKSNLLKKDFEFYSKYNWPVDANKPYVWLDKNGEWYSQHSGQKEKKYYREKNFITL
jgi:hypothetical protein